MYIRISLLLLLLMNLKCVLQTDATYANQSSSLLHVHNRNILVDNARNDSYNSKKEINTRNNKRKNRNKSLIALVFVNKSPIRQNASAANFGKLNACKWLRGHKKQLAQCLNRRGFAKVLQDARNIALQHCQEQFSFDRWDCSKVKNFMFKRTYRETAFMQAITASAVMFSVAKACSDGKLQSCYCLERPTKWVGCGDNTKIARKITRRFLTEINNDDEHTPNMKLKQEIIKNNVDIGLQTVKQHKIEVCVCHGVSASCTMKTCWKVIKPTFSEIADSLKTKYNSGMMYKQNSGNSTMAGNELIYLAQSPNFCDATRGRRCKNHNHCATLCCGRGYHAESVSVSKRCNCKWNDLILDCDICRNKEDQYICK